EDPLQDVVRSLGYGHQWRDIVTVMIAGSRLDLTGRIALVTGASRGIGSAIANALAEQGAEVVLSSRKQADLDAEAERINARFPGKAFADASASASTGSARPRSCS